MQGIAIGFLHSTTMGYVVFYVLIPFIAYSLFTWNRKKKRSRKGGEKSS